MDEHPKAVADELFFAALKAEDKGDSAKAFVLYTQCAERGNAGAQNNLGTYYDSGIVVQQDKAAAIEWYKKAYRTDLRRGNYISNIALTYAQMGNKRQAEYWWRKAITMGVGRHALGYAKFLMKSGRRNVTEQLRELLTIAVNGTPMGDICIDEHEEAQELLKALPRENQ